MKNGVDYYTKGIAEITVNFPEDKIACKWCPLFLRYEKDYARYSCRLTGEWILDPLHSIGGQCPLKIESEGNNGTE